MLVIDYLIFFSNFLSLQTCSLQTHNQSTCLVDCLTLHQSYIRQILRQAQNDKSGRLPVIPSKQCDEGMTNKLSSRTNVREDAAQGA